MYCIILCCRTKEDSKVQGLQYTGSLPYGIELYGIWPYCIESYRNCIVLGFFHVKYTDTIQIYTRLFICDHCSYFLSSFTDLWHPMAVCFWPLTLCLNESLYLSFHATLRQSNGVFGDNKLKLHLGICLTQVRIREHLDHVSLCKCYEDVTDLYTCAH